MPDEKKYLRENSPYSAVLTREQFLFYETRTTAKLLCEGLSKDETIERIVKENLFQYPTEKSIRRMALVCIRRLESMENESLIAAISTQPSDVAKQICLYAMMRQYRLVWDFMLTVVGEKYRTLDMSFGKMEVNQFFMRLQEQDDWVATWIDATITKLKQVLRKILVENYPDKKLVVSSIEAVKGVLSQRKDNLALIGYLLNQEDNLFDLKEKMQNVEGFFRNQVGIFDAAVKLESDLRSDKDYIAEMPEINDALNKIRLIVMLEGGFAYSKIPTLSDLMTTIREGHEKLLEAKRKEIRGILIDCTSAIHNKADLNPKVGDIVRAADSFFSEKKKEIDETALISLLESMATRLWARRDSALIQIEAAIAPPPPPKPKTVSENTSDTDVPKYVEPFSYMKAQIFRGKLFRSEEEIELYLAEAERDLKERLAKHPQGIKIY